VSSPDAKTPAQRCDDFIKLEWQDIFRTEVHVRLDNNSRYGHVPRSRLLGLAALAILAVATAPLTLILGIAVSSAVLVAVAIADTVHEGDQEPSRSA
jgi:hypothetical protein